MIGNADCEANVLAAVEILKEGIDHTFNLANFLWVVPQFCNGIEFIQQE